MESNLTFWAQLQGSSWYILYSTQKEVSISRSPHGLLKDVTLELRAMQTRLKQASVPVDPSWHSHVFQPVGIDLLSWTHSLVESRKACKYAGCHIFLGSYWSVQTYCEHCYHKCLCGQLVQDPTFFQVCFACHSFLIKKYFVYRESGNRWWMCQNWIPAEWFDISLLLPLLSNTPT